jgi:hypothetical protein
VDEHCQATKGSFICNKPKYKKLHWCLAHGKNKSEQKIFEDVGSWQMVHVVYEDNKAQEIPCYNREFPFIPETKDMCRQCNHSLKFHFSQGPTFVCYHSDNYIDEYCGCEGLMLDKAANLSYNL